MSAGRYSGPPGFQCKGSGARVAGWAAEVREARRALAVGEIGRVAYTAAVTRAWGAAREAGLRAQVVEALRGGA